MKKRETETDGSSPLPTPVVKNEEAELSVSIIVPVLNEAEILEGFLSALAPFRRNNVELIVVDGHSQDGSYLKASLQADKVVQTASGRAHQMNRGVSVAKGEILLFLHADTLLPDNALEIIRNAIRAGADWGFFKLKISGSSMILRVVSTMASWRSHITNIATGDQALFVRRSAFLSVGGYEEIPLMEDIQLSRKLRGCYRPAHLREEVITSGRRWERGGKIKTILLMWKSRILYRWGVSPQTLAEQYAKSYKK